MIYHKILTFPDTFQVRKLLVFESLFQSLYYQMSYIYFGSTLKKIKIFEPNFTLLVCLDRKRVNIHKYAELLISLQLKYSIFRQTFPFSCYNDVVFIIAQP